MSKSRRYSGVVFKKKVVRIRLLQLEEHANRFDKTHDDFTTERHVGDRFDAVDDKKK
jgi:hypothetical protein